MNIMKHGNYHTEINRYYGLGYQEFLVDKLNLNEHPDFKDFWCFVYSKKVKM